MYPGLLRKYFAVDSFCHLVKVSICTCIYNFITLQGFLVRRAIFVEIISRIIGGFKKFQKISILGNLKAYLWARFVLSKINFTDQISNTRNVISMFGQPVYVTGLKKLVHICTQNLGCFWTLHLCKVVGCS